MCPISRVAQCPGFSETGEQILLSGPVCVCVSVCVSVCACVCVYLCVWLVAVLSVQTLQTYDQRQF